MLVFSQIFQGGKSTRRHLVQVSFNMMMKNKVLPIDHNEDQNQQIFIIRIFQGKYDLLIFEFSKFNAMIQIPPSYQSKLLSLSGIFCSHISQSLEEAKAEQEEVEANRQEEMREIVTERRCGAGAQHLLWGAAGPLLGTTAVLVGFVLWPTENVFLHPAHWFECMLQCGVVWMGECHEKVGDYLSSLKISDLNFLFKNIMYKF